MQARATTKGQVVIPVALRRKYGIKKGTKVDVAEQDGCIILRPVTPETTRLLLKKLRGSLKGSGRSRD